MVMKSALILVAITISFSLGGCMIEGVADDDDGKYVKDYDETTVYSEILSDLEGDLELRTTIQAQVAVEFDIDLDSCTYQVELGSSSRMTVYWTMDGAEPDGFQPLKYQPDSATRTVSSNQKETTITFVPADSYTTTYMGEDSFMLWTLKKVSVGCCYKDWEVFTSGGEESEQYFGKFSLTDEGLCSDSSGSSTSDSSDSNPVPSPTPPSSLGGDAPSWATIGADYMYNQEHTETINSVEVTMSVKMGFKFYANIEECKYDAEVNSGTITLSLVKWPVMDYEESFNPAGVEVKISTGEAVMEFEKAGATLVITMKQVKDCCFTHWQMEGEIKYMGVSYSMSLGEADFTSDAPGLCPSM